MKISAFFENGDAGREKAVRQTAWIREKYPSDTLVMISAGDFRSDGIAFGVRARDRAGYQMEAGADVILSLPAASVLGGFGKKNFASTALIQRLHAVDRILLLCHPLPGQSVDECAKELKACAMAVFREGTVYRSRLQEALLQKLSFHEAQMRAVICCMPQAEKLLAYSENRKTVRILDTLLQLYYMVETEFLDVREISGKETEAGSSDGWLPERKAFETKAAEELKKTLSRKTSASLRDIAGWTDGMIEALYPEPEWLRKADSLQEIAEKLAAYTMNTDSARLFLLRTILMITQSNMQINALHLYVPYTYVLGMDPEKETELGKIREASWVPFISSGETDPSVQEQYPFLLQIDQRTDKLLP